MRPDQVVYEVAGGVPLLAAGEGLDDGVAALDLEPGRGVEVRELGSDVRLDAERLDDRGGLLHVGGHDERAAYGVEGHVHCASLGYLGERTEDHGCRIARSASDAPALARGGVVVERRLGAATDPAVVCLRCYVLDEDASVALAVYGVALALVDCD